GPFYLLCQNTPRAEDVIAVVHRRINAWAQEQFRLRLSLALDSIEATAQDLTTQHVTQIWHKVREALEQHKAQRFRQGLATLMRPEEPLLEGCVVCHRDDIGASE